MEQKQEKLFVTVTLYLTMLLLILSPIYRDGNHMILTYSQQITRQLIVTANHQTMEVTVNVESSQVPIHNTPANNLSINIHGTGLQVCGW